MWAFFVGAMVVVPGKREARDKQQITMSFSNSVLWGCSALRPLIKTLILSITVKYAKVNLETSSCQYKLHYCRRLIQASDLRSPPAEARIV